MSASAAVAMSTLEFLQRVWPDTGVYVLATPFTIPNTDIRTYAQRTYRSIDEVARHARLATAASDVFFGVHTLKEPRVWNPQKLNRRTGELGAYEVRTQANMAAAKCLFLDLDVGPSIGDRLTKYASQAEAISDLKQFCVVTQLPRPMIVSSGGGLHVYWLVDTAISSPEWRPLAARLRQLAEHYGLRADPARTTDTSSVLRVAGTLNHKRAPARSVDVLHPGTVTARSTLEQKVHDAVIRAGLQVTTVVDVAPRIPSVLGSNIGDTYDGPPVSIRSVVTVCNQMQRFARLRGNVSEPEWYHSLNIVRFVERGDVLVHKFSEGHPNYDAAATEAKVAQLASRTSGPTSCMKLAEVAGADGCAACAFVGKVKSPLVAARYKDPAPAPVVAALTGTTVPPLVIPEPPVPYTRMKGGGIAVSGKTKEGDETHTVIYEHDLYPVRRLVNDSSAIEQQVWCVVLPREGAKEFTIDSDALYDRRKFVTTIANHGLYPQASYVQFLMDYMIAYIAELQRCVDADAQCNHLGWQAEYTQFILPTKVLHADGQIKAAQLSVGASRSSAHVHTKGEFSTQVGLLEFYNHKEYIQNQFFILASLAAPIFYMTGHHGVIINASGEAGASKSTTLYTAASFWGQPELYPINGTNNGATVRGRNERVTTLANLPICVDEITHMPIKDAVDLAMSITQPGHRIRLTSEGVERSSSGSYKATIMLTTANNSLHGALSMDNAAGTAGSMRVVEILFKAHQRHAKHEADAYWHQLKDHYGHIGEAFVQYVITHTDSVAERVREMMRTIDTSANIQPSERFWSAAIASVLVAGEIVHALGLCPYDSAAIMEWALTVQIPYMRGVVGEEYSNPLGILAEYLEYISGDTLVGAKMVGSTNITNIVRAPRGQLLAHFDIEEKTMWVLKKGFKDYCVRAGANFLKILDDLVAPRTTASGTASRILTSKHTRKVLGAGTEYAKAQSWCFAINMAHPEITGAVDLALITSRPTVALDIRRAAV